MNASMVYIAVSILILLIIAVLVLVVYRNGKEKKLTPLAGLALGFVLAGILFGESRLIGYTLLGIGMVLAVIDIFRRATSH